MKRDVGLTLSVLALALGTTRASASSVSGVTTDELVSALPSGREWPAGWAPEGGDPNTQLIPASGNNVGFCGGPNAAARAMDSGVVAYAASPPVWSGVTIRAGVELFAFASDKLAQAYVATTSDQLESCTAVQDFTLAESEFGQYASTQNPAIENATWRILLVERIEPLDVEADDALLYRGNLEYSRIGGNVPTGGREATFALIERYNDVVLTVGLTGSCCEYGFSDVEAHVEVPLPGLDDLVTVADAVRPGILEDLRLS